MPPVLKPARSTDLPLLLSYMEAYYRFDHLAFDRDAAAAALSRLLADDTLGRAWLVAAGGVPVGYVVLTLGYSLEFHGRDAFVDELYLEPGARGQGLGPAVLAQVEAACGRLGVRALHLEVERANHPAQAVYRKAGFEDHDRYLMTKWLPSPDA